MELTTSIEQLVLHSESLDEAKIKLLKLVKEGNLKTVKEYITVLRDNFTTEQLLSIIKSKDPTSNRELILIATYLGHLPIAKLLLLEEHEAIDRRFRIQMLKYLKQALKILNEEQRGKKKARKKPVINTLVKEIQEYKELIKYDNIDRLKIMAREHLSIWKPYAPGEGLPVAHYTYGPKQRKKGIHLRNTIELSPWTPAKELIQKLEVGKLYDFVFSFKAGIIAISYPAEKAKGHSRLVNLYALNEDDACGGRIQRTETDILKTIEWSGHYGHNWTDEHVYELLFFASASHIQILHSPWGHEHFLSQLTEPEFSLYQENFIRKFDPERARCFNFAFPNAIKVESNNYVYDILQNSKLYDEIGDKIFILKKMYKNASTGDAIFDFTDPNEYILSRIVDEDNNQNTREAQYKKILEVIRTVSARQRSLHKLSTDSIPNFIPMNFYPNQWGILVRDKDGSLTLFFEYEIDQDGLILNSRPLNFNSISVIALSHLNKSNETNLNQINNSVEKNEIRELKATKDETDDWYDENDINTLLKNYLSKKNNIEIVYPISGTALGGKTLEISLWDRVMQQVLQSSTGIEINSILLVPLNLHTNHWSLLIIQPNSINPSAPTIRYIDPMGDDPPGAVQMAILKVYHDADFDVSTIRYQFDAINCGPWIVAIAEYYANNDYLLPPEDWDCDITARRIQDGQIYKRTNQMPL